MPIIEYVKGDILDTKCSLVAHGVNCQNKMGSGVAKALYTKYPEVKELYHLYCQDKTPRDLLGTSHSVQVDDKLIVNCFTQLNYGYDGDRRYLSYKALKSCFEQLNDDYEGCALAIPKIGSGLAGGDWEAIETIIDLAAPRPKGLRI